MNIYLRKNIKIGIKRIRKKMIIVKLIYEGIMNGIYYFINNKGIKLLYVVFGFCIFIGCCWCLVLSKLIEIKNN